jgi:hypothetical protein
VWIEHPRFCAHVPAATLRRTLRAVNRSLLRRIATADRTPAADIDPEQRLVALEWSTAMQAIGNVAQRARARPGGMQTERTSNSR